VAVGLILQPSYRLHKGRPVIQLFGRLDGGEAFLVEDDRFRPYFFVPEEQVQLLAETSGVTLPTSLHTLGGQPVVRITAEMPGAVPPLREKLELAGGGAFEADIRFAYRYLIDHGIRAGVAIEGTAETLRSGLLRFANPELRPVGCRPTLSTLAIDLETSPDASRIYCIALLGSGANEVHLVSKSPVRGAEIHPDQRALLTAAAERVRAIDPDVLTGWNVVDFDLRIWAARARALGIRAQLGRVEGEISFQQDQSFTRQSRATLPGRMVLDAIPLVRDAVRLEDYRLETAARAILGRGKLLDGDAPDAAAEITRLYWEDPEALVAYNREDARLVLDILEKEGLAEPALGHAARPRRREHRLLRPALPARAAPPRHRGAERRPLPQRRASLGHGARGSAARPAAGHLRERRGLRLQEPLPEPDPHLPPRSAGTRAGRRG
jgi:DNA polymerase-2